MPFSSSAVRLSGFERRARIISNATFPSYFLKDKAAVIDSHARLDLAVFTKIAKALNITARYVGEEPTSQVTGLYNEIMREQLPKAGIGCPKGDFCCPVTAACKRCRHGRTLSEPHRGRAWKGSRCSDGSYYPAPFGSAGGLLYFYNFFFSAPLRFSRSEQFLFLRLLLFLFFA